MNPPRARATPLLAGAVLGTAALLTRHPAPLVVLLAVLWPHAPRPRRWIVAFALTGFVLNGLFSWHGATELWRAPFTLALVGRPRITVEALALGLVTAVQVATVALAFLVAFTRTDPQAVARLVPGAGPRLATSVALRALPEFARDAKAMRHGMSVRGLPTTGLHGAAHLLVPVVARSLDRARVTVETLHARGAGATPRPAAGPAFTRHDALLLVLLAALPVLWFAHAWPTAEYFPGLQLEPLTHWRTWTPLVALLALPGVRPA